MLIILTAVLELSTEPFHRFVGKHCGGSPPVLNYFQQIFHICYLRNKFCIQIQYHCPKINILVCFPKEF